MRSSQVDIHELSAEVFLFVDKQDQRRLDATEYCINFFICEFEHRLYHQWSYEVFESLKVMFTLIDHLICLEFPKEDYTWVAALECSRTVFIFCMEESYLLLLSGEWLMSLFEYVI